MTFRDILSRGFSAANRSVAGLLLLFFVYGMFQGATVVIVGAIKPQAFNFQPGQGPPPELLLFMGFGCFSCLWMLVIVFGGPWITAGIMGQLGDRISRPDQPPANFTNRAGTFYVKILALTLVFVAIMVVLSIMVGLLSAAISSIQFQPGAMQPQDIRRLSTSPANLALSLVFIPIMAVLGIVFTVANAVVVTEYTDAFTSLGTAVTFLKRNLPDAVKLMAVISALQLLMWLPNLVRLLFELRDLLVLTLIGVATAVYFPYMLLLGMAWGMSLWLARGRQANEPAEATIQPLEPEGIE